MLGCALLKINNNYITEYDDAYAILINNTQLPLCIIKIIIKYTMSQKHNYAHTIKKINKQEFFNINSKIRYSLNTFYDKITNNKITAIVYCFKKYKFKELRIKFKIGKYITPYITYFNFKYITYENINNTADHIIYYYFYSIPEEELDKNIIRLFKKRLLIILNSIIESELNDV